MAPDVFHPGTAQEIPTAKRCMPFLDALMTGFYLTLSTDLDYDGENFRWVPLPTTGTEPYPTEPIAFHAPEQLAGAPLGAEPRTILKFNIFWAIGLTPGWSLFVTHPAHQTDLPFQTISAVIDADRYSETFIQIPTLWRSRGVPCVLPKGTPVAQCLPIPRDVAYGVPRAMDAQETAALEASIRAIIDTPGVYKQSFRASRKAADDSAGD
jgi:hypothetical protein